MTRVKKGLINHIKHKKYLKLAKGYYGRSSRCYRIARRMCEEAAHNKKRSRKINKRNYRSMFISIINIACRKINTTYSQFINKYNKSDISNSLDRKGLCLIAQNNVETFHNIWKQIK